MRNINGSDFHFLPSEIAHDSEGQRGHTDEVVQRVQRNPGDGGSQPSTSKEEPIEVTVDDDEGRRARCEEPRPSESESECADH